MNMHILSICTRNLRYGFTNRNKKKKFYENKSTNRKQLLINMFLYFNLNNEIYYTIYHRSYVHTNI